jgi:hypothetical protein
VLALKEEGYALCACGELPVSAEILDPCKGLEKAVLAKAEQGAFGELNALYVRKSSAELNAGK